jgi:hypothetical protein
MVEEIIKSEQYDAWDKLQNDNCRMTSEKHGFTESKRVRCFLNDGNICKCEDCQINFDGEY